jgi:hypothetical protein
VLKCKFSINYFSTYVERVNALTPLSNKLIQYNGIVQVCKEKRQNRLDSQEYSIYSKLIRQGTHEVKEEAVCY